MDSLPTIFFYKLAVLANGDQLMNHAGVPTSPATKMLAPLPQKQPAANRPNITPQFAASSSQGLSAPKIVRPIKV